MISNLNELSQIIKDAQKEGKKVVLATGTFDLLHYEHVKYLEGAKKQGDILVVGLKDNKGAGVKGNGRPIIDEQQRIGIVDAIRYVDYSFLAEYNPDTILEVEVDNNKQKEWLYSFQEAFKVLRPDILYFEDNEKLLSARERVFEKYGITGIEKPRGKGASTTDIIEKIKNL